MTPAPTNTPVSPRVSSQHAWGHQLLTALLTVVCFASTLTAITVGYQIWQTHQAYHKDTNYYTNLTTHVTTNTGNSDNSDGETPFPLTVDFEALQAENPDIIGWLYSPGTPINYPIMSGKDYDHYLHHLPDGNASVLGSLFTDYNHSDDFTDQLSIIYGHHSANNAMFASLTEYKNPDYYLAHPTMYLATPTTNYTVEVTYGAVIPAGQWREKAFMYTQNLPRLLAYMQHHTTFNATNPPQEPSDGPYLLLSTCTYEYNNARYLLLTTLTPTQ